MSTSLQTSFNSAMKDLADKYDRVTFKVKLAIIKARGSHKFIHRTYESG